MEALLGVAQDYKVREECRLQKTLYGLKQSPKAWFGRLTKVIKENGYHQSNVDHTIFLKKRGKLLTCLIIYVDDMIIIGSDIKEIKVLKEKLFRKF